MQLMQSNATSFMFVWLVALNFAGDARSQLVWQQEMKETSAVLPLTLDNDIYRVRAKPPEGVLPNDISCDIGITGTVLSDQRGTSASDPGEKAVSGLRAHDNIDVLFSDRVYSGKRDYRGNRIIDKYDFECGINIKYENKKKVAQVEIRPGYILPSGDVEGLSWAKLNRKLRQFNQNIAKCEQCENDIANLESECQQLQADAASAGNNVYRMRIQARLNGIDKQIALKEKFASRKTEFERDLAAFNRVNEYLKTKVHGCQIYVHFHHDGETLPVDIDELKRNRIRPIQVFEPGKDPHARSAGG